MQRTLTYTGLVTGLAIVLLSGCSVANDTETAGANKPEIQNPLDRKTDVLYRIQNAIVYEVTVDNGVEQLTQMGPVEEIACTPEEGCMSVEFTDQVSAIGTINQGLELDGRIDPRRDCEGNCAPINVTWCGGATLNGQPYNDRWMCMANIDAATGRCRMTAIPVRCEADEECRLNGVYPSYGMCQVPAECQNDAQCSDGLFCNGAERCVAGFCQDGIPLVLNDQYSCTEGRCDEALDQITQERLNDRCNDNLGANGVESCNPGAANANVRTGCVAGVAPNCADQLQNGQPNTCTRDIFVEGRGCVSDPVPMNGVACDDGRACTVQDTCQNGACNGQLSCVNANPCQAGACGPNGACQFNNVVDGTQCLVGAANGQCVLGNCELQVCDPANYLRCRTVNQQVGFYSCDPIAGSNLGRLREASRCGAVNVGVCAEPSANDPGGCRNPPAVCQIDANCLATQRCNAGQCVLRDPETGAAMCGDTLDNDGDGAVDCNDGGCAGFGNCPAQPVQCQNNAQCAGGRVCQNNVCVNPPAPPPPPVGALCYTPDPQFVGMEIWFWGRQPAQFLGSALAQAGQNCAPAGVNADQVGAIAVGNSTGACAGDPNGLRTHVLSDGGNGCQR